MIMMFIMMGMITMMMMTLMTIITVIQIITRLQISPSDPPVPKYDDHNQNVGSSAEAGENLEGVDHHHVDDHDDYICVQKLGTLSTIQTLKSPVP